MPSLLKKHKPPRSAAHINEFRTDEFRVFNAGPYFNLDLWYEIEWHKKHIAKLKKHAAKPILFHRELTSGEIDHHRERHFQEHVTHSIPFHERILTEHELRLKTILQIIPLSIYKKLVAISRKYGGTPEYLVYSKRNKEFFFVAEHLNEERMLWIKIVEKKKLCHVVQASRKIY